MYELTQRKIDRQPPKSKVPASDKRLDWRKDLRKNWPFYVMLLPAVLSIFIFSYGPMFGVSLAFLDFTPARGVLHSEWVGLKWFQAAFESPFFLKALRNTVVIKGLQTLVGIPSALLLAMLLNEVRVRWFKSVVQTATILPYFISWVIIGTMFQNLFRSDGALNEILVNVLGLEPIGILRDPQLFRWFIVFQDTWKFAGYFATLYLAAMASIDPALYEAALVDGANRGQRVWHITLPGIRSTFATVVIWLSGYLIVGSFEQIFVQYNVSVYPTADILETLTYRLGIGRSQYSLATAVGFFQSIIAFGLMFLTNRLIKIIDEENALF
jgi:ABC-type polysaccharide transport system permease subunit